MVRLGHCSVNAILSVQYLQCFMGSSVDCSAHPFWPIHIFLVSVVFPIGNRFSAWAQGRSSWRMKSSRPVSYPRKVCWADLIDPHTAHVWHPGTHSHRAYGDSPYHLYFNLLCPVYDVLQLTVSRIWHVSGNLLWRISVLDIYLTVG